MSEFVKLNSQFRILNQKRDLPAIVEDGACASKASLAGFRSRKGTNITQFNGKLKFCHIFGMKTWALKFQRIIAGETPISIQLWLITLWCNGLDNLSEWLNSPKWPLKTFLGPKFICYKTCSWLIAWIFKARIQQHPLRPFNYAWDET